VTIVSRSVPVPILARGAHGEAVLDVQARLSALGYRIDPEEHGEFGSSTEQAIREFQQRRQLLVDGLVGRHTWDELVEAGYSLGHRILYLRYPYDRGDDVRTLQSMLNLLGFDAGREDGIFGQRTDRALREFQKNVGLPSDGILGGTTIQALGRLRPVGPGPGRATVREGEALRRLSASLEGAVVAVDAGHGAGDPGGVGPSGLTEAESAYLLAGALAEQLRHAGAKPVFLRGHDDDPGSSERARTANEAGAEVLVAIHLNSHGDPRAEGASTYFYGREAWSSPGGQRLAELIQEELTSKLGLKDGRTHAKALPLLRETHMPAVHVEPCFVTNPREEEMLRDAGFRTSVAACLTEAIGRFFGRGAVSASAPPADPLASPAAKRVQQQP
jgi:N-acetylmuramoyl-L-alanine amidase